MKFRKKPITVEAVQWFPGKKVDGVLRIPASRVDQSATRGIVFDRPERHVVNTPIGQWEVAQGNWVVTEPNGERMVYDDTHFYHNFEPVTAGHVRKWWRFWHG